IHESCNGSQSLQLKKTLQDMVTLADYARTTLLDNGGEGELEKQYFGEGDIAAAIGYYSRIVRGSDKVLFRCDDPDGNCQLTDYYGHWRGDNATDETVICEKSFQGRRPLEQTCGFGFQLGTDKPSTIWPVDVLHRVMHLPSIVSDRIAHVADTYADVLELASTHPEFAVSNQLTLQLYAIDSWS
ncbi:zincin, partial [Tilletiopsis washingtonensis]